MPVITGRVAEFCQQCADAALWSSRTDSTSAGSRPDQASRRRLLAAGGGIVTAMLAGCTDLMSGSGTETPAANTTTDSQTPTERPEISEVDVVGLQYKPDGSSYQFIVTLDPPAQRGGADWWQVETLGGEKLVRHEFEKPRVGDRFTTTAEMTVEDGISSVVVRGHDAEGEYGGQVMLANFEDGIIEAERQGDERTSFEDYSF